MSYEAEKAQLKEKLERLLLAKFAGDSRAAFAYYDVNDDGKIDRAELIDLLKEAEIGNWLTRGRWTDEILTQLDHDKDGALSMAELEARTK